MARIRPPSPSTSVLALALVPVEYLYGIATGSPGALVAGNLLLPVLGLLAAWSLHGAGGRGDPLLLAAASLAKAALIATTPSPLAHYVVDTLVFSLAALQAARASRTGAAGLVMVLAGAAASGPGMPPGLVVAGLALEAAGLVVASAALSRA